MVRTRKKAVGREPSLRDKILHLLIDVERPMTAKDIAECLDVNKTTPFRPLSDLVQMQLVVKNESGVDGAEYCANPTEIAKLGAEARRIKP